MVVWIIRRLLMGVSTVAVLSLLIFIMIQLPAGDYLDAFLAEQESATGQRPGMGRFEVEQMRAHFGLDKPLHIQYLKWVWNVVRFDLGWSLNTQQPVTQIISERLFLTVVLALFTVFFTWLLAVPIGIYSAVRKHTPEDYAFTFIGFIGLAIPDFLLALVMMYFAFQFFDLSIGGLFSPEYLDVGWSWGRVIDLTTHLWIPAVVLGTSGTAALIRIMRANTLDELSRPYVVTARAKGLSEFRLILKYPVRVALNPFVSTIGYVLPYLFSGSVIVSVVLSLPTIGPILLRSLLAQDTAMAATILWLMAVMTVVGTLISDILLMLVDPRIRIDSG